MAIAPGLASVPRRLLGRLLGQLLGCVAVLIVTETEAYAFYIDPGSGALLLQALLAAFFGGLFYFRKLIARMCFWRKTKKNKE